MTEVHLVRLPFDLRAFTGWALDHHYLDSPPGDRRGRPRDAEIGYALHAALTGLFGSQSPRPFAISPTGQRERQGPMAGSEPSGGVLELFGYANAPVDTLRTLAHLADDGLRALVDWEKARSKQMPTRWPKNLRLRFDLRACPVRRIMKPLTTRPRPNLPVMTLCKGKEVDAFQVAAVRARDSSEPIPSRDQVYIEWLNERLTAQSDRPQAVFLVTNSVRVETYRSVRLLRRPRADHGRRAPQWLTRPDVRFSGLLEIADPDAFSALLVSGVGRHCGFGFGMMLLTPA